MGKAGARVLRWDELAVDRPMASIERQRIIGEHVMISRVKLAKDFVLATHAHQNEQMVCMVTGRASFLLDEGSAQERRVTLSAGEVLHLPPWTPHGCTALEACEIWDLFSPPSATTGVDQGPVRV